MSSPWMVEVTPESAGWRYAGLRTANLGDGESLRFSAELDEALVLPLIGGCVVECGEASVVLIGRRSVFDGPTDFAYVPRGCDVTVTAIEPLRVAVATARAEHTDAVFRHVSRGDVGVEKRGAGSAQRTVHNFCVPDALDTDRLMAVEVITPGGNWSSWPPHKHDEDLLSGERAVEEIYYYEGGPGYQRVYSSAAGEIDVMTEVSSGDVVLVPYGYHGPTMAAPGYDLYSLNVLAGAGRGEARSMASTDDPRHAWVRDSWEQN